MSAEQNIAARQVWRRNRDGKEFIITCARTKCDRVLGYGTDGTGQAFLDADYFRRFFTLELDVPESQDSGSDSAGTP